MFISFCMMNCSIIYWYIPRKKILCDHLYSRSGICKIGIKKQEHQTFYVRPRFNWVTDPTRLADASVLYHTFTLNIVSAQVTTVALSDNVAHLAIGLGDGTVVLFRHLDQSLASSTSLTSLPKVRTVHESPTEPITGLGFKEPRAGEDDTPNNTYLFIVTTNKVLSYQVSGRGSGGTAAIVDDVGAGLGCATMDRKAKNMVIARDEAIYLCGVEGRGTCYAYEGTCSSNPSSSILILDIQVINHQYMPTNTMLSSSHPHSFRLLHPILLLLEI